MNNEKSKLQGSRGVGCFGRREKIGKVPRDFAGAFYGALQVPAAVFAASEAGEKNRAIGGLQTWDFWKKGVLGRYTFVFFAKLHKKRDKTKKFIDILDR